MAVVGLDITKRSPFADGESFGEGGAYELLEGTAHFSVDPENTRNHPINDLELAPRDSSGKVRFSSNFAILQPTEQQRGNHRILFDVVNRGRKTALSLNGVPAADPTAPLAAGNGFLMRHG